jgi:hypothetical protein
MKLVGSIVALGFALALGTAATPAAADRDHAKITLTGCVVAGEEKNSFVLTNAVVGGEDARRAPEGAFFRLDSGKGLKNHVGRLVELSGEADLGDVDKGKLAVKTDGDGTAQASITTERKTVKAEVGKDSGLVPGVMVGSEGSMKADISTYKFKVSKVRVLGDRCQG